MVFKRYTINKDSNKYESVKWGRDRRRRSETSVVYSAPDLEYYSVYLDGSTGYLIGNVSGVLDIPVISTGSKFTFSTWFKPEDVTTLTPRILCASRDSSVSTNPSLYLAQYGADVYIWINVGEKGAITNINSLVSGVWTNIAVTAQWVGSDPVYQIYINGVIQDIVYNEFIQNEDPYTSLTATYMGVNQHNGVFSKYLKGYIASPALWTGILSSGAINYLATNNWDYRVLKINIPGYPITYYYSPTEVSYLTDYYTSFSGTNFIYNHMNSGQHLNFSGTVTPSLDYPEF